MDLTADQRERLNDAMVAVFNDDYRRLKRFMKLKLDFNVSAEIESKNVTDAVFEVIERFEPENIEETDLRRLLVALCDEFGANETFRSLAAELGLTDTDMKAIRFEMSQEGHEQGRTDHGAISSGLRVDEQPQRTQPRLRPDLGTQRTTVGHRERARKYIQSEGRQADDHRQGAASRGREGFISKTKMKELLSALSTLRRVSDEFNRALKEFVTTQTEGYEPDFDMAGELRDALDRVDDLATQIQLSDDHEAARGHLSQLLIDVQAAIDVAEQLGRYDDVRRLAQTAGDACQRLAEASHGDERLILLNVVPYWRMRAAYAEHQPTIATRTVDRPKDGAKR